MNKQSKDQMNSILKLLIEGFYVYTAPISISEKGVQVPYYYFFQPGIPIVERRWINNDKLHRFMTALEDTTLLEGGGDYFPYMLSAEEIEILYEYSDRFIKGRWEKKKATKSINNFSGDYITADIDIMIKRVENTKPLNGRSK